MKLFGLVAAVALGLLITYGVVGTSAVAAEGIELRTQSAQNRFPDGAQINGLLASDAEITLVRLRYQILPYGSIVSTRPQCTTGLTVNCSAVIGNNDQGYMVPGAEIEYWWEVEDASGRRVETERAIFTYNDTRFQWQSISEGNLTVYYYFGDDVSNQATLRTARETIDKFSAIEGTSIDYPIKIWVYQTARDLAAAAGGRQPINGHTLGQVGAPDTAIVSRDTDFLNIVRHELTHIVTRAATDGNTTSIPNWMNEGMSTYAQTRLLPSEEQALALAVRTNRLLPITSLSTALRGVDFSLAYAQSGALMQHLIEVHGPEKFATFVKESAALNTDAAMQKVYGFDQLGLENEWRRSIGLPEVSVSAGSNQGGAGGIPTLVPFGANQPSAPVATVAPSGPSSSGESVAEDEPESSSGSSGMVIVVVAMLAVLAVGGGGFFLLRSRKGGTPAA